MGLTFTLDTPAKVGHFGITSVVHVFINELKLYIDYLRKFLSDLPDGCFDLKQFNFANTFKKKSFWRN